MVEVVEELIGIQVTVSLSDQESIESNEVMHHNSDSDLSSQTQSGTQFSSPKPPKRTRSESVSPTSSPRDKNKKFNRTATSDQQVIGDSVFFHGGGSPFSNFHSCSLKIPINSLGCPQDFLPKDQQQKPNVMLQTTEHLYQYRKAWAFKDKVSCKDILNLRHPGEVKKGSYQIKR